jgi:LacI family transcriptional regulator
MSAKRITITDIARESGASPTTVSLVLRDKPGIGTDTRDRVLAAAQSLGYERKVPSGRVDQKLTTVAILFRARTRSPFDRSLGVNPFYSWVLTGMESVARTKRMNLIYGTLAVNDDNQIIDVPDHLLSQALDGVAMIGAFSEDSAQALVGSGTFPVVLVDGPAMPQQFDVVASDNVGGARQAVEYLFAAGHRQVGLVSPAESINPNFAQREEGYRLAMMAAGMEPLPAQDRTPAAIRAMLAAWPGVTALFCVNDVFATELIRAADELGIEVPDALSVVGFDDTDHASASTPPLTTMAVDKVSMGRQAIHQLDYRMAWPDAARSCLVLSPRLIARGTVAPPNHASIAISNDQIAAG